MDSASKAIWGSAVVLALAMIVAADFLSVRYQLAGDARQVYRLDRITGIVTACVIDETALENDEGKTGMAVHCEVPAK